MVFRGPNHRPALDGVSRRHRRRLHRTPNQGGFTLIEILVAVVMLAILIVPMFDAFVRGRSFVARRGEKRMALRLVERKCEQLLSIGYGGSGDDSNVSSVNVSAGVHPNDPSIVVNSRGDTDPSNDVIGRLTWNVHDLSWASPGDDVEAKGVVVKLAWPESAPRDSVSVTLLLGR